ncbi:MAG: hypothetical protein QNJ31_05790 [Candidatus Caenarcaniphilales bacterium]|nr:hypothetical protein [Candidatus Caenarcaniphilales bacterium]
MVDSLGSLAAKLRYSLPKELNVRTPSSRCIGEHNKTVKVQLPFSQNKIPKEIQGQYYLARNGRFPKLEITTDISQWVYQSEKDDRIVETKVYSGNTLFDRKKQEIIKLPIGASFLLLSNKGLTNQINQRNRDNGKNLYLIAAGLKANVPYQASLIAHRILQNDPKSIIAFLELKGQGLTHLKVNSSKEVSSPSIYSLLNPFVDYEKDFRGIIDYLVSQYPDSRMKVIALSTSSMPLLKIALEKKYTRFFQKLVLNGPYTGLSHSQMVLQNCVWTLSPLIALFKGKGFKFSPMAEPWKLNPKISSIASRLESYPEIIEQKESSNSGPYRINILNLLHEMYPKTTLQFEPSIRWTDNANRYYLDLLKYIEKRVNSVKPEIEIVFGEKDTTACLNKGRFLAEKLDAKVTIFQGPNSHHNGYHFYPDYLVQELIND